MSLKYFNKLILYELPATCLQALFIFSILSCQSPKGTEPNTPNTNSTDVIDLNSVRDTITLDLGKWCKNITLSPLDNQESALVDFGKVVYALVDSQYIFTVEQDKPIKVFTAKGSLDQVIGSSGKGPGEYLYPRKLVYNSQSNMAAVQTYNGFDPVPVYSLSSGEDVYTHPSSKKKSVKDINLSNDGKLELLTSSIGSDTSAYWIERIDLDKKENQEVRIGTSILNMGQPFLLDMGSNTIVHIPQSDTMFSVNPDKEIRPFRIINRGIQGYAPEKYIPIKDDPGKAAEYIAGLRDYSIQSIAPSVMFLEMINYGGGRASGDKELFMTIQFSKLFHDRKNNKSFHIKDFSVELPGGLQLSFDDEKFWSANGYFVKVFDAITLYDKVAEIASSDHPDHLQAKEFLETMDVEDNVYVLSGRWE